MAAAAQSATRSGELTIYNEKHPAFAYCFQPDVLPMLEQNLETAKTGLTVKRLAQDLSAMLIANPSLAFTKEGVCRVTAPCVFGLMLAATRYQTTFGDGGLWPIPDDSGTPTLRPQESKKFIKERAESDAKCEILRPVFVHKPDHPVIVERDPATGDIVKFTLNSQADITETRNAANLLGAFGRVKTANGTIRIRWFDKADLDRFRDHSTAYKAGKSPSWTNDPMEMYAGSVMAAMGREFAPIRTRVPGMVSTPFLPAIEMEQAADGQYAAPTAASAAADLVAMADTEQEIPFGTPASAETAPAAAQSEAPRDPVERAKAMFLGASTLEGLEEVWKSDALRACQGESDSGQLKHIANARAKREKEIREGAVAAARAAHQQAPAAPKLDSSQAPDWQPSPLEKWTTRINELTTQSQLSSFFVGNEGTALLAAMNSAEQYAAKVSYNARKDEVKTVGKGNQ